MGNNDFTAQAGISLEQWKKDIATMTADMNKLLEESKKASGGISFIGNAIKAVGAAFGFKKLLEWGKEIANAGEHAHDAARNVDLTAESFTALQGAMSGALKKEELQGALTSITTAMDEAKNGSVEMADALTQLGVASKDIDSGNTEEAFLSISDAAKKGTLSVTQLNKVFGESARAVNEAFKKTDVRGKLAGGVSGISNDAAQGLKDANRAASGLWESLKNKAVNTAGLFAARTRQGFGGAPMEPLEREKAAAAPAAPAKEQKKDVIDIAEAQRSHLKLAQGLNISAEAQINLGRSEVSVMEQQLALLEQQGRGKSIAAEMLRKEIHDRQLQTAELEHQLDLRQQQARNTTAEMNAELAGNKLLSDLQKNELDFELKIKQARHEHRLDLVAELTAQRELNNLQIRAAQLRKTPQQLNDDRKEQQAQNRAVQLANAQDKNRVAAEARDAADAAKWAKGGKMAPLEAGGMAKEREARADALKADREKEKIPGFARAGERISPAAARARAEFLARHPLPNPANKAAQAQDIKAQNIIVANIKHGN